MSGEENAIRLKNEIDSLANLSSSITRNNDHKKNYSDFWERVRIINVLFKELKPLNYEDRQTLWKEFSSICDETKENQFLLTQNNAIEIRNELNVLSAIRAATWNNYLARDRNYSQFWECAKGISEKFKTLKPLKREDREDLWNTFSDLCESVRGEQKEYYANFERCSQDHYSTIMGLLRYAVPHSSNPDELKDHGRYLKQAGQFLSEHKHDMTTSHKKNCFERIQEIQKEMDAWWETVKCDRQRRHAEFQASIRANLEKNIERHRKATDFLEHMRDKADELQSKIDSAWNDDWISKAYGWMSEFEDKIRDTEEYIRKIEEWIEEDERKLR